MKTFCASSSEIASGHTFLLKYSQLGVLPSRMLSRCFIALLILFWLRLTNFPNDFLALDFFTVFPNAKDLKAANAALFSFEPEFLTSLRPCKISVANAFKAVTSFCSSGVVTTPRVASNFLVRGLSTSFSRTAAFFSGVKGRAFLTLSVAHFFDIRFENPTLTLFVL